MSGHSKMVPVPMLGFEASGIVVRTSQGVTRFQPGDRVAAHAYESHSTVGRTHEAVVHKLLDSISFEEGAAINLVHVTAYHALVRLAKLLQMPTSEVDSAEPLYRCGIDSLTAIEVRNWISRELKANMALLEIVSAVPIKEFAGKIAKKRDLVSIGASWGDFS